MKTERAAIVALIVTVVLVIGVWRAGPSNSGDDPVIPAGPPAGDWEPPAPILTEPVVDYSPYRTRPETDPLAGLVGAGLNAEGGSIRQDLEILADVFDAWQSNFPGGGNPVGTNQEITRSLGGLNRLSLDLIPGDHPAVNRDGELCDRWGTPFEFHQISGSHMEIRSAGPDTILYTEDDVVGNPGPTF